MFPYRSRLTALVVLGGAFVAAAPAQASDQDVRNSVTRSSAIIVAQEKKLATIGTRFAGKSKPSAKLTGEFRAAARGEARRIRLIRGELKNQQADTPNVAQGRDLIVEGLGKISVSLDSIQRSLGRLRSKRGSQKAALRAIVKAQKSTIAGNKLIEKGEPLVGAELTPAVTPTPAS